MSGTNAGRRSAREWAKVVRAWRQSGLAATTFAAERGISPNTFAWWRWKLARDRRATRKVDQPQAIKLVRVQVDDSDRDAASTAPCSWELVTAAGHALRVYTRLDTDELRSLIEALTSAGTRS